MKKISIALVALAAVLGMKEVNSREMIIPAPIPEGARLAIVAPASAIKTEVVDSAVNLLRNKGYEPVVYPHVYGSNFGTFPATDAERAEDLMKAFADDSIDAILCARGGYGCVRLLPMLDADTILAHPKWLIGYSDITILHSYLFNIGMASVHAPMLSHLNGTNDTTPATMEYWRFYEGLPMTYEIPAHPYNKTGYGTGRLAGGNLITFNNLAETPWDVASLAKTEDIILFFEDISEKIPAIERILMRLHYADVLKNLKGVIVGQFTEYSPNANYESMEDMIYHWLQEWGYYDESNPMPIVFDFPTGHVEGNYPMVVGSYADLTVTPEGTTLTMYGNQPE